MTRAWLVLLAGLACSSRSDDSPPPPPPPIIADAGVDGITAIVPFDPASGMHLDDDSTDTDRAPASRRPRLPGVAIGIALRSEPMGAMVAVDGENLGPTPQYWTGIADGSEHTFAFMMANHALAHYRFVPTASGVLFATLKRVSSGAPPDAGFSQEPPPPAPVRSPPVVRDRPSPPPVDASAGDAEAAGSAPGPQP